MQELKKRLLKNPQKIKNTLERFGFHNVRVKDKEIRCAIDENSNETSTQIRLNENLSARNYAKDIYGDLFSLIIKCKNVELKDIVGVVKEELGIINYEYTKRRLIFGGFYDNIKIRNNHSLSFQTYDESVLNKYSKKYNTLFLKDGISIETQRKYKIGMCHQTSRIIVPWYSFEGELIGLEGRYTGDYEQDNVPKWFPIIPFPKSRTLFGYHINYQHLQESDVIYIGESAKFSMQLDTMGIYNSVALGGNSIHREQIKWLIWLNPKKIIFCYDEGLEQEVIQRQVEKTKEMTKFFDIQIGVVHDENNNVLPKGSKSSPSDLGILAFKELVNNYVKWM